MDAVDVLPDPVVGVVGVDGGLLQLGQVAPQQQLLGGHWHLVMSLFSRFGRIRNFSSHFLLRVYVMQCITS